MHLCKRDPEFPGTHPGDIHKFRIARVIIRREDLRKGIRGIQGRQARDAQLHGPAVDGDKIAHGLILYRSGIDDIIQLPAFQKPQKIIAFYGILGLFRQHDL